MMAMQIQRGKAHVGRPLGSGRWGALCQKVPDIEWSDDEPGHWTFDGAYARIGTLEEIGTDVCKWCHARLREQLSVVEAYMAGRVQ